MGSCTQDWGDIQGKIGVTPTLTRWLYQRCERSLSTLRTVPAPVWKQTNVRLSPRAQS